MDDEPVPERIGDYLIERCLGEGGMAKVYLARHAILETTHAIKVLDPSYRADPAVRKRFLDEAKIQAGQLDHPNIVKVVNIVATPEHAALVMELVDGPSLESQIGALQDSPATIRSIMLAVLDAVGYAHGKGIIHRDLKPANVLLAKRGSELVPKVTDFGIAKIADGGSKGKKSTHADARMGTLNYSSPEQLRSPKDVTARSDVFSLGVVLYELATGHTAFPGESDYDVMDAIVKGRYVPPEQHHARIDPAIAAVIRQALDPAPAKRFASCREMAQALGGASVPMTSSAPPVHDGSGAAPRGRGLAIGLVLGAVVVLGGVAAVVASRRGAATHAQEPTVAAAPRDASVALALVPDAAAVAIPPPVVAPDAPPPVATPVAVAIPEAPPGQPGDDLIGTYTCQVTCTDVGSQRCGGSSYGCAIARDAKGTLRLRKSCCSFAWNLAISAITDTSFVVSGDVCYGNGPCIGKGTLTRRGPNRFSGRIFARDMEFHNEPVENDLVLIRAKK